MIYLPKGNNIYSMKTIHRTDKKKTTPVVDITAARIAAIKSGGTLTAFLRSRGFAPSTAWYAMQGRLRGPRARQIVEAVKAEFGV